MQKHCMISPVFKASSPVSRIRTSLLNRFLRFMICIFFCSWYLPAVSQDTTATLTDIGADSSLNKPKELRQAMEELGERARVNNIQKYNEGRNAIQQANIINEIKRITLEAGEFEKTSIDTTTIWKEFHTIDSLFYLAGDGIFRKAGTIQTHRNLTISYQ